MRSTRCSLPIVILIAAALALAGCRRGGEPAAAETAEAAPTAAMPAEARPLPPPDSLYGATAVDNLQLTPVELEIRGVPRGWDGMRIAVLSDLLIGYWPDNARVAEAAVRRAVAADPDLVVLLGDFLVPGADAAALDRVLAPLQGRGGLAVLGDRDLASEAVTDNVLRAMGRRGITVLRNSVVAFARGGDTAYIAGVEPAFTTFAPPQQAELLAALPEGAPTPILLSHLPDILPRLPEARFPVVLAGNTFCGQATVPGTPRLVELSGGPLGAAQVPRTNRLFRSAQNTLFVTCGTGYSFVPMRVGAPPEVAIVRLLRIPEPRPAAAADTTAPPEP